MTAPLRFLRPLFLLIFLLSAGAPAPVWGAAVSERSPLSTAARLYQQEKYKEASAILRQELSRHAGRPERVETLFLLASSRERQGFLEEALDLYEKVSRGKVLGDYALYRGASILARLGDPEGALERLSVLLERFPRSVLVGKSYALAAGELEQAGDLPAALQTWKRWMRCCSENSMASQALFHQAALLEKLGRSTEALELYRQIGIRFPSSEEASRADKRLQELVGERKEALRLSDQDLWQRARAWFHAGRPRQARRDLSKLLKEYPHSALAPGALFRLGASALDSSSSGQGISTLEDFLRLYPNDALAGEALYELGRHFWRKNQQKESRKYLRQLLSRYPENARLPQAYLIIGRTYEEEGKLKKAREVYEKLILLPPPQRFLEEALWRLGWNYYQSEHFPEAYGTWQRGAALTGGTREGERFTYWQARAAEKIGARSEALSLYRKLQGESPYSYYGHLSRTRIERRHGSGRSWPGTVQRRELLPRPPDRWRKNLRVLNASAFLLMGFHPQAQGELDALARELPRSQLSRYWLANLYARGGFFPQSFHDLDLFLRHLPQKERLELPREFWKQLYPVEYRQLIADQARLRGLPESLLFAVIRQESAFDPRAISRAGARGLLQLLPATARRLSQGERGPGAQDLFDPRINIPLGSKYLSDLLQTHDGRLPYALAGYNAGESALKRWLSKGKMKMDEFIESIPYPETRNYVKRVLRNLFNYQSLYAFRDRGKDGRRISLDTVLGE